MLMMFTWWSAIGLVLDLAGVLLLGFDLIQVQRMLRAQAAKDLVVSMRWPSHTVEPKAG